MFNRGQTAPKFRIQGHAMKLHFYAGNDDDAERCKASLQFKTPITVSGADALTGRIQKYAGVVLSVEKPLTDSAGEHWRVVIEAR